MVMAMPLPLLILFLPSPRRISSDYNGNSVALKDLASLIIGLA